MNIALGQYYPSGSVMHRLDPRIKFILAIAYIVAGFVCKNVFTFALLFVSIVLLILMSKIPLKTVFGSIKAIIFIMVFTAIINIFLSKGEPGELVFSWRFIKIYESGLYNAAFIVIRILAMIIGASVFLTYTTTPIQLTDAIERLFSPLKLIRVPVHEFAMMMTIALRFIPTIVEETEKIMAAQKSRGTDFSGNVIKRIKSLVPIIIPLFISAFRRAGDLAVAMTCRCYRGGKGRTRMTVLKMTYRDVIALLLMVVFIGGIIVINILSYGYTMK